MHNQQSGRPRPSRSVGHALTVDDLAGSDFDTLIVAGVDMYGRLTGKRIPLRRLPQVQQEGLHVCTCVYAWDVVQELGQLRVDYAGDHTGWHDFRLVPDMSTLRRAAWLNRTAIVMADSVDEHSDDLVRVAPRTILHQSVERLSAGGLAPYAATELEFHLYKGAPDQLRTAGYRNLDPTTAAHADYNIIEGDRYEAFFGGLRQILENSGVPVEVSQVEYGFGQWEINLEYSDPVEMCDRHVLFKHIVKHQAAAAEMTATFMPRPLTQGMGSSCHIHASVRGADGANLFHDPAAERTVSHALRSAVGGILAHTPELMLWYAPTINSMRRTLTQDFAGNGLTWGFDNRTTTCRVITGEPHSNRVEMRLPGSDVNPYLAVAAVLESLGDGITAGTDPGPATGGDGYHKSDRVAALPMTLDAAADAFHKSDFARSRFGADVVDHYVAVARDEWSSFLLAVGDWERRRYLESI